MVIRIESLEDTVKFRNLTAASREKLTAGWARIPEWCDPVGVPENEWFVAAEWFYISGTPIAAGEQFRLISRMADPYLWEIRKR